MRFLFAMFTMLTTSSTLVQGWISIAIFFLSFDAQAVSIQDIQEAIDAGKLHSANQALDLLPKEMKQLPVLSFDSRSLVPSSAQRPRMVMAQRDGTFYAAVSTDEKSPMYNSAEFAQLNHKTNELDFYLLEFNGSQPRLQKKSGSMYALPSDGYKKALAC